MHLHLSRHMMINIAFILLLSLFTSGFLWTVYLQKENNHNIDRLYRSTNWYANRILYQSEKFLYKAELYQLGAIPLSDLTQSYDLVWNRLQLFLESSTTELLRTRHPQVTKDVETLFNSIKALSNDFNEPSKLHSKAFTDKVVNVKNALLKLDYSLNRVLTSSISEGIRTNNDLIQFWQLSVFIITVLLSTALLRMSRRSAELAQLDPLTQLGNRRALSGYLNKQLKRSSTVCLYAIDLKLFKQINDHIGYQVGDLVLVKFAQRLAAIKQCKAFRLGGDEFVLICTKSGTPNNLVARVKELQQQLEFDYQSEEHQFPVRVRIGITYSNKKGQPKAEELLDQAILALDETKRATNKDYAFYHTPASSTSPAP
ncbi:GGDEF domain-containing protein [Vibrio sp. E150_018]